MWLIVFGVFLCVGRHQALMGRLHVVWTYLHMICFIHQLCDSYNITFECFEPSKEPKTLEITAKSQLLVDCANATKISIRDPEVFYPDELTQDELDTLFNFTHLDMCIKIHKTDYSHLNMFMKRLTGQCEGPVLDILGNYKLTEISVGDFLKHMKPDSIRIHGNPQLNKSQLTPFDGFNNIQVDRECLMPVPLWSPFELVGCDRVYGIMKVPDNFLFPTFFKSYTYTGCIQITSNHLKDLDFLQHFKRFTRIPGCSHYIANNPNLCVKNRTWLRATFANIEIYNNKPDCDFQCLGGEVTEAYLNATAECETRIGDVIIRDWNEKPKNADFLYNTKYIEGRLIIVGNDGLGDFKYFSNLEVIGAPNIAGNEPALLVENNTDLKSLEMPKLSQVSQKDKGVHIRVRDNVGLQLSKADVNTFTAAAGGSDHVDLVIETTITVAKQHISHHVHHVNHRNTAEHRNNRGMSMSVFLLVIIIPVLILLLAVMLLLNSLRSKSSSKQLKELVGLSPKSRIILAGMCKEILEKNPFVWMIQDRPLIWRYPQDDSKRSEIDQLKGKHATFLQNHALKIFPNARIPLTSERAMTDRVRNIINHEEVLIIGADNDISLVVPSLPSNIGGENTYKAKNLSVTSKLERIIYTDDLTRRFTYTVTVNQDGKLSKKKLRAFFYVWDPLRLPIAFNEIGRLIVMCSKKKMPCISDRRKEIFSLLHMIFTYVNVLQQSIGVVEAFQLHTDTVNGAPLDCCEMLCVMAFILEWAHQTYSVPKEIEQKHSDWCHTYARMSKFYSDYPNKMIVHPENLITSRKLSLQGEISQAGRCAGDSFSERSREVISDKFRRRTAIELKSFSKERVQSRQMSSSDDETTATVSTAATTTTLPYK